MAKKMPKFDGFTLADIAEANTEENNSTANISNAKNSVPESKQKTARGKLKNDIAINSTAKLSNTTYSKSKFSNDKNSIGKNGTATGINQGLFARVRGYLYNLLGDQESVEVKFSEVIKVLDINPHSFYKYMRILKETDFVITKLRYSTEIKKREAIK